MWHDAARSTIGLVLVFPSSMSALWDPEIGRLTDQIARRLDGKYVTHAVASGGYPTVADGVAAARFAGCRSVLVAYLGDPSERSAEPEWVLPGEVVGVRPDPDAIVARFRAHAVRAGRTADHVR